MHPRHTYYLIYYFYYLIFVFLLQLLNCKIESFKKIKFFKSSRKFKSLVPSIVSRMNLQFCLANISDKKLLDVQTLYNKTISNQLYQLEYELHEKFPQVSKKKAIINLKTIVNKIIFYLSV